MSLPSFIEDPAKFRKVNGWLTVLWLILIPVSAVLGLLTSVVYVSALSLYAIVTGHLATWQAARVEERQEQDTTEQVVQEIKQTQEEEKQTRLLNGEE
jgi:hypothetical protein